MKHYYVIEFDPRTHIKTERPIESYDFFCRHEKGNVTGEELFDYNRSNTEEAVAFVKRALDSGYEIQTWNSWRERVRIVGVRER